MPHHTKGETMKRVPITVAAAVAVSLCTHAADVRIDSTTRVAEPAVRKPNISTISTKEVQLTEQYLKRQKEQTDDEERIIRRKQIENEIENDSERAKKLVRYIDWCIENRRECGRQEYIKYLQHEIHVLKKAGYDTGKEEAKLQRIMKETGGAK